MATHNDPQHAVNGQMSANTWALTLILHRTQRVADEAINRALNSSRACKRSKASSVTRHGRHRTSPALHVTRKTRSRRLAVAPLHHGASRCTMEHHDATGVTTPRQTVKASPHRHKWMLSHGAPADPSDPWNSHAAPVSPRQNSEFLIGFVCKEIPYDTRFSLGIESRNPDVPSCWHSSHLAPQPSLVNALPCYPRTGPVRSCVT